MTPEYAGEIVRRARSVFFAGNSSEAWTLICAEAARLEEKEGQGASSGELYRQALEQIHVDLAEFIDQLSEVPAITELDLSRRGVLDKHLPFLRKLTSITKLNLGFNEITDAGMPYLAALTSLADLNLRNNTKISDLGVAALAALPSLTNLDLRDTKVGDVGLSSLSRIRSLKLLLVGRTIVTSLGTNTFRRSRPDVTFHW